MKLIKNDTDLTGIDCHTHSRFSPDANAAGAKAPQEIADDVRAKGLKGFIVTDHIDLGHWSGYIIDFDKYFSAWEKVRRDNPDLKIYIGLEVGYEKATADATFKLINDLPLEYVINSVHYWQGPADEDDDDISAYEKSLESDWDKGRLFAYNRYLKCVLSSLDAPYAFNTVGHLGLPERYAPYPKGENEMSYELFSPLLDKIAEKAVKLGVRFEENTNGVGDELRLPRADFLKTYKKIGGVRPVLGSDAHTSDGLGKNFDKATAMLDGIFGKK